MTIGMSPKRMACHVFHPNDIFISPVPKSDHRACVPLQSMKWGHQRDHNTIVNFLSNWLGREVSGVIADLQAVWGASTRYGTDAKVCSLEGF